MAYRIDRSINESAYIQLYHQIKKDIVDGNLISGMRLPSKRTLASELHISVITVEHSYMLLLDEGYIVSRPKSGYYVTFSPDEEGSSLKDDSSLSEEVRFFDPPEPITEADADFPFSSFSRIVRNVLSERGPLLLMRSPNTGIFELKSTLGKYLLLSRGVHVKPEQIILGSGAEHLYSLVLQLLGSEKTYAVEYPCYERILSVYNAYGIEPEKLALGKHGIHSRDLLSSSADVLHVTPWSSYPSGITASASKRHEYISWVRKNKRYLIEDDYDSDFSSPSRPPETLYALFPERVIYINTFTKTLAPSMRMGYMILPEELVPVFYEKLGFYSCTVPVLDQYILEEFIREGHLERYINRRRRRLKKTLS